jgi:hypothetical protein
MANTLHEYIKNYDDFLSVLKVHISNLPKILKIKFDNAEIINNNNTELLIGYVSKERKKLIKKIKIHHSVLRVNINAFDFEINKEDYNNLLSFIKSEYFNENKDFEIKKENVRYLTGYFRDIGNSVFVAFYNSKIKELKGGVKKDTPFYNPVFENAESKLFFEFLIKEWFNGLPKPKSAISYAFYSMWQNSLMPIEFKDVKYKIKVVRIIDFANYWNDNYSELHKYNYKIQIENSTARIKTISEITNTSYENKLNSCIETFVKQY